MIDTSAILEIAKGYAHAHANVILQHDPTNVGIREYNLTALDTAIRKLVADTVVRELEYCDEPDDVDDVGQRVCDRLIEWQARNRADE